MCGSCMQIVEYNAFGVDTLKLDKQKLIGFLQGKIPFIMDYFSKYFCPLFLFGVGEVMCAKLFTCFSCLIVNDVVIY